ncbi:hypothetical protein Bhyg_03154 [Pseudolycoriella hygida]|uniref:Uncharacterized protein n=1 Tax=Pseudolycoriella hygida TaxID=35572 RepID=A0A9Q0S944_9DIPT|nr:hypothetical protein Bhyg_03154 [Pseudolycoriella hygida]
MYGPRQKQRSRIMENGDVTFVNALETGGSDTAQGKSKYDVVDDEWEKMYLEVDDDDNKSIQGSIESEVDAEFLDCEKTNLNESEGMYLDSDVERSDIVNGDSNFVIARMDNKNHNSCRASSSYGNDNNEAYLEDQCDDNLSARILGDTGKNYLCSGQSNDAHVVPQFDDEWERMYFDIPDNASDCGQDSIQSEMDDEYLEWEKGNLCGHEEMYIPLAQIDNDFEAIYLDGDAELDNATNDKDDGYLSRVENIEQIGDNLPRLDDIMNEERDDSPPTKFYTRKNNWATTPKISIKECRNWRHCIDSHKFIEIKISTRAACSLTKSYHTSELVHSEWWEQTIY